MDSGGRRAGPRRANLVSAPRPRRGSPLTAPVPQSPGRATVVGHWRPPSSPVEHEHRLAERASRTPGAALYLPADDYIPRRLDSVYTYVHLRIAHRRPFESPSLRTYIYLYIDAGAGRPLHVWRPFRHAHSNLLARVRIFIKKKSPLKPCAPAGAAPRSRALCA